ncbi:MAG: winged helix-turn-helix domain-containing protein [Verrucomicrobiales bacterium]|nr:winged helix-turn-helix domain-containing protein [Verrucomicrobiales bacterium]
MATTATSAGPNQKCLLLGDDFRLDLRLRQLYRRDRVLKLERIPIELLILLVENPSQLVTREQIVERIWGGGVFLDTDNAIRGAVHKIRRVLRDNPEQPRFVQTIAGQGYRFVAPVTHTAPESHPIPSEGALPQPSVPVRVASRWWAWAVGGLIAVVAFLAAYARFSPLPAPKVMAFPRSPVSDGADPWQPLITDGVRVYFLERTGNRWDLVQSSAAGGEVSHVAAPFSKTRVFDVSRERAEFLIGDFAEGRASVPIWIWPVHGGAPVRVGKVRADDAAWRPGGGGILYAHGSEIRSVQRNGGGDQFLIQVPGTPRHFVWSPDGTRLIFTVIDEVLESYTIWEAAADGSGASPSYLNSLDSAPKCCATWTPDGRYLLFTSRHNGTTDLWAMRERRPWWHWGSSRPVRLTSGPMSMHSALPLPDGKRIYAFADAEKFESNTYSTASRQYAPLLPGKEVLSLSFSRDGQWTAYQIHPEWTLWRSKLDGTHRIPLTVAPMKATHPQWSPDGKRLVFEGYVPGGPMRAYVVSAEGGQVEEIWKQAGEQSLPVWSPDGESIALALNVNMPDTPVDRRGIFIVNWKTRQAVKVPASDGLTCPLWSPDGKHLVARTPDDKKVLRFDPRAQNWREVFGGGKLVGPAWSPGGDSLYVQDVREAGQPVYRVGAGNWKRTRAVSFEKSLGPGVRRWLLQTVAPDGSLVISLVRSESRVYALEVDFP